MPEPRVARKGGADVRTVSPSGSGLAQLSWRRIGARARFGAALVLALLGSALWVRSAFTMPPARSVIGPLSVVLDVVAVATYSTVGLLVTLRRPEVRIGALQAWIGVCAGLLVAALGYLAEASTPTGAGLPAQPVVALLVAVVVVPLVSALEVTTALLFPTDRPLSADWWRVARLAAIGAIAQGVGSLIRPGTVSFFDRYDNPFAISGLGQLADLLQLGGISLLGIAALLTAPCLIRRYARGDATERAQLRVYAALGIPLSPAFVLFEATLLWDVATPSFRSAINLVFLGLWALWPVAIALAVARYRLFAIDRFVGRTFVYGSLTAMLAGIYAASVKLFEALFVAITGESSEAALVLTTLVLVTTFTPLKHRLEGLVKRGANDEPEQSMLDDPAFVAKLDDHVRALIAREVQATRSEAALPRTAPRRHRT